jgi:hypothetical protein
LLGQDVEQFSELCLVVTVVLRLLVAVVVARSVFGSGVGVAVVTAITMSLLITVGDGVVERTRVLVHAVVSLFHRSLLNCDVAGHCL